MAGKLPWRVLYVETSTKDDSNRVHQSPVRSKSFRDEDAAIAWACEWIWGYEQGNAIILHKDAGDLDPVPGEHRVTWVNGNPVLALDPPMAKAAHEQRMKDAWDGKQLPDVRTYKALQQPRHLRAL